MTKDRVVWIRDPDPVFSWIRIQIRFLKFSGSGSGSGFSPRIPEQKKECRKGSKRYLLGWIGIRIRFVLKGMIRFRIRSISDRIRNPATSTTVFYRAAYLYSAIRKCTNPGRTVVREETINHTVEMRNIQTIAIIFRRSPNWIE